MVAILDLYEFCWLYNEVRSIPVVFYGKAEHYACMLATAWADCRYHLLCCFTPSILQFMVGSVPVQFDLRVLSLPGVWCEESSRRHVYVVIRPVPLRSMWLDCDIAT